MWSSRVKSENGLGDGVWTWSNHLSCLLWSAIPSSSFRSDRATRFRSRHLHFRDVEHLLVFRRRQTAVTGWTDILESLALRWIGIVLSQRTPETWRHSIHGALTWVGESSPAGCHPRRWRPTRGIWIRWSFLVPGRRTYTVPSVCGPHSRYFHRLDVESYSVLA